MLILVLINKYICIIFLKLPLAEEHSTANKFYTTFVCRDILAFPPVDLAQGGRGPLAQK